jgi:hypothetical protein
MAGCSSTRSGTTEQSSDPPSEDRDPGKFDWHLVQSDGMIAPLVRFSPAVTPSWARLCYHYGRVMSTQGTGRKRKMNGMQNTNTANVWELFNTYAYNRREGRSHPEAEGIVRETAASYCNPSQINASLELGAALHWWGSAKLRSDFDMVAKWRAAGSPVWFWSRLLPVSAVVNLLPTANVPNDKRPKWKPNGNPTHRPPMNLTGQVFAAVSSWRHLGRTVLVFVGTSSAVVLRDHLNCSRRLHSSKDGTPRKAWTFLVTGRMELSPNPEVAERGSNPCGVPSKRRQDHHVSGVRTDGVGLGESARVRFCFTKAQQVPVVVSMLNHDETAFVLDRRPRRLVISHSI